jgi:hypothetical protein
MKRLLLAVICVVVLGFALHESDAGLVSSGYETL